METTRPSIIARPEPRTAADLSRARKTPTPSHPVVRSRRPSRRPDLRAPRRRAQRQSRMAEGHREAAPRVLDGREHGGSLAAEGRSAQNQPHRRLSAQSHRRQHGVFEFADIRLFNARRKLSMVQPQEQQRPPLMSSIQPLRYVDSSPLHWRGTSSAEEARALLGAPAERTFYAWRAGHAEPWLPKDTSTPGLATSLASSKHWRYSTPIRISRMTGSSGPIVPSAARRP